MKRLLTVMAALALGFAAGAEEAATDAVPSAAAESTASADSAVAAADGKDDGILFFSGVGIMAPYFRVHAKNDGARNLAGALFCNRNTTVDKETGLTLKLDLGAGGLWIDSMPNTDATDKLGGSFSVELGMGHAFVRNDDTVFSLCASVALLDYFFSGSSDVTYSAGGTDERLSDASVSAVMCGLGADMQFIRRLGGSTYLFADVGAYYLLGRETCEYSTERDGVTCGVFTKRDVYGVIAVTPTLGLCWRF